MKKEKLPDGFPIANDDADARDYPCDNCGKHHAYLHGFMVDADSKDDDGNYESRNYGFCCQLCAEEFARDNGLILCKSEETDMVSTEYKFTLKDTSDPVAEQSAETNPKKQEGDNDALSEAEELERLRMFNNRLQKQVKIVEKAESEWLKATGAVQAAKEEARALKEVFDAESKTLAVMVKSGVSGVGNELPGFSPEELEANESEPAVVDLSQYPVSKIGISESIHDKLQDAKILTVEDLRVYLNQDPRNREKIPGIGTEKLNAMTDKLNAFTEQLYKKK